MLLTVWSCGCCRYASPEDGTAGALVTLNAVTSKKAKGNDNASAYATPPQSPRAVAGRSPTLPSHISVFGDDVAPEDDGDTDMGGGVRLPSHISAFGDGDEDDLAFAVKGLKGTAHLHPAPDDIVNCAAYQGAGGARCTCCALQSASVSLGTEEGDMSLGWDPEQLFSCARVRADAAPHGLQLSQHVDLSPGLSCVVQTLHISSCTPWPGCASVTVRPLGHAWVLHGCRLMSVLKGPRTCACRRALCIRAACGVLRQGGCGAGRLHGRRPGAQRLWIHQPLQHPLPQCPPRAQGIAHDFQGGFNYCAVFALLACDTCCCRPSVISKHCMVSFVHLHTYICRCEAYYPYGHEILSVDLIERSADDFCLSLCAG